MGPRLLASVDNCIAAASFTYIWLSPRLMSGFEHYRLAMDGFPVASLLRTICFQIDNPASVWCLGCIDLKRNPSGRRPAPGGNTLCWLT